MYPVTIEEELPRFLERLPNSLHLLAFVSKKNNMKNSNTLIAWITILEMKIISRTALTEENVSPPNTQKILQVVCSKVQASEITHYT